MDLLKETNLRKAINYCIEKYDANKATDKIIKFIKDEKEAINFIQCCMELNISFKKGDEVYDSSEEIFTIINVLPENKYEVIDFSGVKHIYAKEDLGLNIELTCIY
jgi:hypothetical protein